jgi:hypothetical protein
MPLDTGLHNAKICYLRAFEAYLPLVDPDNAPALLQQIAHLSDSTTSETFDALLTRIAEGLGALRRPLLLIVDAWERTPDALITWVERLLLLPLVRSQRLIGAFGSQVALRWRQFEVRRRVKARSLEAFSPEFTRQQLDDNSALSKVVFEMTFGHPFANEVVFEMANSHDAPLEWLEQHRGEVAQRIVDDIQERVLADVTEELKRIFRVIALFREFDVNTLRAVLPQFYEEFRNRSQSALLISIKQLLETRLVSWSDEKRAYQIDPTVRRIFARALEWSNPKQYEALRDAAIAYYETLIRDIPGSRNVYLIEYYYHHLYKADPDKYNQSHIQLSFQQFLQKYYVSPDGRFLDEQSLHALRQVLEKDQELQETLRQRGLRPTLLSEMVRDFTIRRDLAPT